MNTNKKTPKLRFKGFTDDWEQRKLTSFTQRVKGNDGRMDLPTLTISASEGWLNQKDRFSANIAGSEQKNYTLLRQGELSYNHGNSKLAKYGVVYALKDYKEALVPRVYHSFRVDESYDALFVEYYFSTKRPDRELGKLVSSGARMDGLLNIGYDEFTNISISVPTFSEQKQIVALLKVCDKYITLHQRKLEKLKLNKSALLQKLFPQKGCTIPDVRFKGFTDAWEQRKLNDFGIATGGTSIESEFVDGGTYKVINIGSYSEESVYNDQGLRVNKTDKTKSRILNKYDLTMILNDKTASGNIIGRVLLIDQDNTYVYNQRTERIEVDTKNFLPMFLYHMLNAPEQRKYIVKASQGNTQIYVNWSTISNIDYMIPQLLLEQEKIANLFSLINKDITLHQRKLDCLISIKKGLLQQLFV